MKRFSIIEQGQVLLFGDGPTNITTLIDPEKIPSTATPNGMLAPLWSFHLAQGINSKVYMFDATSPNRIVFQWTDFYVGFSRQGDVTLQALLYDDGKIEFDYCQLDGGSLSEGEETGAFASIGIESPDGTSGVDASFRQANAVDVNTLLTFTPSR
jgi:hypothetical protein